MPCAGNPLGEEEVILCISIDSCKAQHHKILTLFQLDALHVDVFGIPIIAIISSCNKLAVDIKLKGRAVTYLNADILIVIYKKLLGKIAHTGSLEAEELVHPDIIVGRIEDALLVGSSLIAAHRLKALIRGEVLGLGIGGKIKMEAAGDIPSVAIVGHGARDLTVLQIRRNKSLGGAFGIGLPDGAYDLPGQ